MKLASFAALVFLFSNSCWAEVAVDRPDYKALEFPEQGDFQPARPTRHELDNGMVVYVLEDHEFPTVSMSLTFRTGSIDEPVEQLGLASITGELMRLGGTKSIAPADLDRELEDMASSVESSIGASSGSASAWTLTENLDRTFAILADVVLNPRFEADKFDLIVKQLRTGIQSRNDDAGAVASREFERLLYGRDYPYARVTELAHIDAITVDDIAAFHAANIGPAGTIVGIVGDITVEQALALTRQHFGEWKAKRAERQPLPEPASIAPGVYYADVSAKSVTQTVVRLGHLGVKRDHPDYPIIIMLNYILGGGGFGTSRLLGEVRTNLGLAYSVYSSFRAPYERVGTFFAGCETKSESTVAAIKAILSEIDRIRTEPVSKEELDAARREILNSEVFNYDSPSEILARAVLYEFYDYPQDLLEKTLAALRDVSSEDIQRVAGELLHPDKLIILAVGDAKLFGEPLADLDRGEVTTLDISIPVPEKRMETLDFSSAEGKAKAREIAAKVVSASGGEEKLRGTSSVRMSISLTMAGMPPGMSADGVQMIVAPDRVRFEMTAMGMVIVQIVNGAEGWIKQGPMPTGALNAEQVESLRGDAERLKNNPWIGILDGKIEATAGGTVEEDGRKAAIIGVKEEAEPTVYYVDMETGDILRSVNILDGARSESVMREFKVFDGRRIATHRTQLINGDEKATITVKTIEFDVELDDELFTAPE